MQLEEYKIPIQDKNFIQHELREMIEISYSLHRISKRETNMKLAWFFSAFPAFFSIFDKPLFIESAYLYTWIIFIGFGIYHYSQRDREKRLWNERHEIWQKMHNRGYSCSMGISIPEKNAIDPRNLIKIKPITKDGEDIKISLDPFQDTSYQ
ncbi:MAG: hypothetical protein J0L77_09445 [Alphaproteobacteria bacterium]|nr:hypothetical protein [Alphaproteobacteria bacterium]